MYHRAYEEKRGVKLIYDLRILEPKMHGMARYGLELLRALLEQDPDLGVAVLVRTPELAARLPKQDNLVAVACDLAPYGLRSQIVLPKLLARMAHDIYHAPFYAPPLGYNGPLLFTIHDMIHLKFPKDHGLKHRMFYRGFVAPAARKARAVFTVSEHSKKDISEILRVPPQKIVVTPNGVSSDFSPLDPAEKERTAKELGLPSGYILGVGNPKPHKNLQNLIKAHELLKRELGPDRLPPLLLVGVSPGDLGLAPDSGVICREHVSGVDLPKAYAAAGLVAVPSLYEGFGLPALEALASGAPLICSDRASLPEVAGKAGLVCAPDAESLAGAMKMVLTDGALAADLAAKGPRQAAKFTWREAAAKTLGVYRRVAERGSL